MRRVDTLVNDRLQRRLGAEFYHSSNKQLCDCTLLLILIGERPFVHRAASVAAVTEVLCPIARPMYL